MEQEALDEQLLEVGPAAGVELPSVPTAEPIAPKTGTSLITIFYFYFSVITIFFILILSAPVASYLSLDTCCNQCEGSEHL